MSFLDRRGQTVEEMSALTRDNFELYVGVGTSQEDLMIIFRKKRGELDEWCRQNYSLNFDDTYALLLRIAVGQYKDVIAAFASEGHKTAMSTMNELVLNMKQNDVQKIQIVSDMEEDDE